MITEFEALQNAANGTDLTVKEYPINGRRTKLYCFVYNGTIASPNMDYDQANHFILGYRKALNKIKP